MQLWRINLKPQSQQGIDAAEFCTSRGIVGIGWAIDFHPASKEEYLQRASQLHGTGRGWKAASNAILFRMRRGDLIWTRNRSGVYFLGRVDDDWRYESQAEFVAADITNIRSCTWTLAGPMDSVPGSVINGFRPRATVQLVVDENAITYSQFLFAKLTKQPAIQSTNNSRTDLLKLLSDEDLEDVVALWIQLTHQCMIFPSTCKHDTIAVECIFVRREDGKRIGLQVKSGNTPINLDNYASFDGLVYLFAASENYLGTPHENCVCLKPEIIRQFVIENQKLMPERVRRWTEYVASNFEVTGLTQKTSANLPPE